MKLREKEYRVNDQGMIVEEIDHYEEEEYNLHHLPGYELHPVIHERPPLAA